MSELLHAEKLSETYAPSPYRKSAPNERHRTKLEVQGNYIHKASQRAIMDQCDKQNGARHSMSSDNCKASIAKWFSNYTTSPEWERSQKREKTHSSLSKHRQTNLSTKFSVNLIVPYSFVYKKWLLLLQYFFLFIELIHCTTQLCMQKMNSSVIFSAHWNTIFGRLGWFVCSNCENGRFWLVGYHG